MSDAGVMYKSDTYRLTDLAGAAPGKSMNLKKIGLSAQKDLESRLNG